MIRVTEVISFFLNLWRIPEEVLARKADQGKKVHEAIYHCTMVHPFGKDRYLNEEYFPYIQSYLHWFDENKPAFGLLENRLNDPDLGFSGEPDALVHLSGKPHLIDFKTSAKDDPVGWRLQGSAYVHLLRKNGFEVDDVFYFLKLDKMGNPPKIYAYKYTQECMDTFLKALDCARFHLKWKGTLSDEFF